MEIIHQIIIESVANGFWHFIGYWLMIFLILGIPAKVILVAITLPFSHFTIRKHGYPPHHCDADGDFKNN